MTPHPLPAAAVPGQARRRDDGEGGTGEAPLQEQCRREADDRIVSEKTRRIRTTRRTGAGKIGTMLQATDKVGNRQGKTRNGQSLP